jgi:cytochrome c biogenesis protein CcmG, thiol:disulfide interchange protein DsbE
MKTKLYIGIGIGAIIIGAGVLLLAQGGDIKEQQGVTAQGGGQQLADLNFKDYQGNAVTFADFQGKPLVVNAWAAWCPFCVKELPDFAALQEEFPDVVVIAIDRAESLQTAKSYTDNLGITDTMTFLLDPSDSFYKSLNGFSMPETVFVDREGVIQDHKRGPMELKEMKERLQSIL